MSSVPNDTLLQAVDRLDVARVVDAIKDGATNLDEALLKACCKDKSEDIVGYLLNAGAGGYTEALLEAARSDHLGLCILFFEHGYTDINTIIKEYTLFHNRNVSDIQLVDNSKQSALNYELAFAARYGDVDAIQYFAGRGANNFDLAYAWAAETNQTDACQKLISMGAKDHDFALQAAAKTGSASTLQLAYSHGASNHNAALTMTCKNNMLHHIKMVIEKGATNHFVALETAVKVGSSAIIKFVLERVRSKLSDPKFRAEVSTHLKRILDIAEKQGVKYITQLLTDFISSELGDKVATRVVSAAGEAVEGAVDRAIEKELDKVAGKGINDVE
jgi:hypothetical protein